MDPGVRVKKSPRGVDPLETPRGGSVQAVAWHWVLLGIRGREVTSEREGKKYPSLLHNCGFRQVSSKFFSFFGKSEKRLHRARKYFPDLGGLRIH